MTTGERRTHVFISYKRDSPDEEVARRLRDALAPRHHVFIDQDLPVGTRWAARIEEELRRSDFLITLLSAQSVESEMVRAEVETAAALQKDTGRPAILPVRLAYREPFKYPLSAHLNEINWAYWGGPADTDRLIDELTRAMAGGELALGGEGPKADLMRPAALSGPPQPPPAAQPSLLEMPEGTIGLDSEFYVERSSDAEAHAEIGRPGTTITIKGPRQMGKSSLLIRLVGAAARRGKRGVFLDFQLFDSADLEEPGVFLRRFCSTLTAELEMEDRVEEHWRQPLSNTTLCTRYVGLYLLKKLGGPLTLAMDEVDTIFETSFKNDFFSMLRSWHNKRANEPAWRQLDLVLVTSTEPYQLIENLNQSPFNVGLVVELEDFDAAQVADLNRRHGGPLDADGVRRLMGLLNGHPYLVRRALYLVASGRMSLGEVLDRATDDRGPFGDHLRYHLFRLHGKADLIRGLREVILRQSCPDLRVYFALRGAGLVRGEGPATVPRCRLYADYFKERLDV